MKKQYSKCIMILSLALLFFSPSLSFGEATAVFTADALAISNVPGGGRLLGILVITDGTNDVTLDLYNNNAASGTKLFATLPVSAISTAKIWGMSFNMEDNVRFSSGNVYVDITISGGGTASYQLFFERK